MSKLKNPIRPSTQFLTNSRAIYHTPPSASLPEHPYPTHKQLASQVLVLKTPMRQCGGIISMFPTGAITNIENATHHRQMGK